MRTDTSRVERGANPQQTFATFNRELAPKCYDAAKLWSSADAPFQWLLIYGGVGNGKTHLCSAALNQLVDRGLNGTLRIAALFLSMLRAGIADHSIDDMMAGYQALPYLILDDLGAGMKRPSEPSGEWEWMQIEQLLVARYDPPKPTMVVTNLDWRDLPPRIASRFQDTALSRIVRNDAGDYRGKK
jgi:DNA replication protein DnaC